MKTLLGRVSHRVLRKTHEKKKKMNPQGFIFVRFPKPERTSEIRITNFKISRLFPKSGYLLRRKHYVLILWKAGDSRSFRLILAFGVRLTFRL